MSLRSELSLVSELASLQEYGAMCDTRLVGEDGSVALHWPLLELRGVWWAGAGRHSEETVVILPGVTKCQLEAFVDNLYIGGAETTTLTEPVQRIKFTVSKEEIKDDISDDDYMEEDNQDFHYGFKDEDSDGEYDDKEDGDREEIHHAETLRLIENDDYSELCEKLCQMFKAKYPACIKVDQGRLMALLPNIKVKKLKEKYSGTQDNRGQWKKVYSCSECGTECKYLDKILKHTYKHYEKPFYCEECEKFVAHVEGHLKVHTEERKANKINICEICNKNCTSKYNLDLHIEAAHTTVHCDQCDFSCVGSQKLRGHRFKKHSLSSGQQTKYPCHICGKIFSSNAYLKTHILAHSGAIFPCEECEKTYNSEKALQLHTLEYHLEKKFVCVACGEKFSTKARHDIHFTVKHTNNRDFPCPEPGCDYRGKTSRARDSHKDVHKPPRYKCRHCGKMFRQSQARKAHEMTHTGERPYGCRECSFRCIQPNDLTKHYAKIHKITIQNPISFITKRI